MNDPGQTVKSEGEISCELVRLNTSKEGLHDRIGILCDKLQDLLGKSKPPEPETTDKCLLVSQLAINLSSISSTLESDIEKVNDILNRLEL